MNYSFFRFQMDIKANEDGTYSRDVLQLCWQKPMELPPYVGMGIVDINLAEYPKLKALIEQATALSVPIALEKLENINNIPEEIN